MARIASTKRPVKPATKPKAKAEKRYKIDTTFDDALKQILKGSGEKPKKRPKQ